MLPDEGEPKPNGNGTYILHFTNCNCDEPCPKCHAPDSDYPLEDAIRDHRYYRKYFRYPHDRHGKERFLMNFACDCYCDRCAEKTNGRVELPLDPIIHHAELREAIPNAGTEPTPAKPSCVPLSPLHPIPPVQLTDFARRLALLKTNSI